MLGPKERVAAQLRLPVVGVSLLALVVAAPVGAVAARENPKKKAPGQLWREFPLGRALQQPSRMTTISTATRFRSTEKPKAAAAPTRATSAEKPRPAPTPAPASTPAPAPAEPAPLDLPGKGQGTTFADFALVIGYAAAAVLLVLGGVGLTGRVRRLRRRGLARAVPVAANNRAAHAVAREQYAPDPRLVAGPPAELDLTETALAETDELERQDFFDGLVDPAEEAALPAADVGSLPEPEIDAAERRDDVAATAAEFELVPDYSLEAEETAETELEPTSPPEFAEEIEEPAVSVVGLDVSTVDQPELEPIPAADSSVEAKMTDVDETPDIAQRDSPVEVAGTAEEPAVVAVGLAGSDVAEAEEVGHSEPGKDGFVEVGDRVATILQAAVEAAERIRREAIDEAATIRGQAETDAAARFTQLTAEIERVNSESQARAEALREEGERYVAERLLEADAEADKVIAEAEAQAQARRAAAEEAARIEDEARRRQAILKEAALALEQRLRGALEGIQHVSTDLEEALLEELSNAGEQRRDLAV